MKYEIYYLPFAGYDDDGNPEPAREMDNKMALDDHTPTQEEFDDLWEKQVEGGLNDDELEDEDEALRILWEVYNRTGSNDHPDLDEKEMRSLSKHDIVILDGTAYLCARWGWDELEALSD